MFELEGAPNVTGQLATSPGDGACTMAQARLPLARQHFL